jgi:uncharacterized protein (DUF433 family)
MASKQHSLRVPMLLIGRSAGRWSSVVGATGRGHSLSWREAVRASRVPGIVFVQRGDGRRPAVVLAGLEVWEIVSTWKEASESWERLVEAYPELTEPQLRAAVAYYQTYRGDRGAARTRSVLDAGAGCR